MRENVKQVLFIASIALNVVFAVTYVAYKLPWLTGAHQPAPEVPLFLQLDLTPDQLKQLSAERDSFHARLQELRQEIKTRQIELIDLLGAASADSQKIERKQEEIQRLQEAVQDRVIAHFLQEGALLTPAQRGRFFELIKERIETGIQTCPPWMRSIGQGKPGENSNE